MKIKDALISWNPAEGGAAGSIKVGRLRENWNTRWAENYLMNVGGCFPEVSRMSDIEARHYVLSEFVSAVVGGRVNPQDAHREFMKIDEYRRAIPSDFEGAE